MRYVVATLLWLTLCVRCIAVMPGLLAWLETQGGAVPGETCLDDAVLDVRFTSQTLCESGIFTNSGCEAVAMYGTNVTSGGLPVWQSGGTMYFDGTDDYIDFGADASLQLEDGFTVTAWANFSSVGANNKTILSTYLGTTPYNGFRVLLGSAGGLYHINKVDIDCVAPYSTTGVWVHVATTYTNGTATIYVDGILKDTGAMTVPAHQAYLKLYIGADKGALQAPINYMHGYLDDVRLYNRTLTSNEIYTIATE